MIRVSYHGQTHFTLTLDVVICVLRSAPQARLRLGFNGLSFAFDACLSLTLKKMVLLINETGIFLSIHLAVALNSYTYRGETHVTVQRERCYICVRSCTARAAISFPGDKISVW